MLVGSGLGLGCLVTLHVGRLLHACWDKVVVGVGVALGLGLGLLVALHACRLLHACRSRVRVRVGVFSDPAGL
jgi:hypothetical protein